MDKLPPGITGFYHVRDASPPPAVDQQMWKAACYHVARHVQGRVTRYEANAVVGVCNYHMAIIGYTSGTVAVLCNAHYPLLAFTDQLDHRFGRIHFITQPLLAKTFAIDTTFTPLDLGYLCAYPEPLLLSELHAVERKQIQAWRPEQVGDIIFNHWD